MALNLPPPNRIAIGHVVVQGQRVEVFLDTEWARYFNSLNTQVVSTAGATGFPGAPGSTGAAGSAVSFAGDSDVSVEFIPGPRGEIGPKGDKGPMLFVDAESSVEFIPGPIGPQGPKGEPGPVIFLMQEPENNDVFWPIRNS